MPWNCLRASGLNETILQGARVHVMKQVSQNYKTGKIAIEEVSVPTLKSGGLLVRMHYSVISAGTEGMKVREGNLSYLGKARARPDKVKQVLDTVQQLGLLATYRKVMNKLDTLTPLGYAGSGEIVALGADTAGLSHRATRRLRWRRLLQSRRARLRSEKPGGARSGRRADEARCVRDDWQHRSARFSAGADAVGRDDLRHRPGADWQLSCTDSACGRCPRDRRGSSSSRDVSWRERSARRRHSRRPIPHYLQRSLTSREASEPIASSSRRVATATCDRAGSADSARPRPRGGHRQDQARLAVE